MFLVLTTHLIILFAFLALSSVIGNFMLQSFSFQSKLNKYENIFFSLLIGTIVLSFFTGIFLSSGITFQWLLLVVAIFLLFELNKDKSFTKINFKNGFTNFYKLKLPFPFFILIGILLIFIWQIITHYQSLTNSGVVQYKDLIFYADLSQNLVYNGNENQVLFANEWFSELNGITPYHYFELWINALVGSISGNYLHSFIFITNSWFLILTWLGFSAIASRIRKSENVANLLIGFAGIWLLSFSGSLFSETGMWKYADALTYSPSMVIFQKTAVIYPFFLAAWILWLNNKIMLARITLLFLPVVSVTMAPAVILSLGIFSLSDLTGKNKNTSNFFKTIIYTTVFVSLYFIIVQLFGNQSLDGMGFNKEEFSSLSEISYIADVIYFCQTIPLIQFFAAIPWLLLIVISYYKKLNLLFNKTNLNRLLILLTFWLTAFASWQILAYQGADAMQFFTITAGIILNLAFFLIFINAIESNYFSKIMAILFIAGGIIYSFWHNEKNNHFIKYDNDYAESVLAENKKLNNPNKAFILSANDYKETSDYHPYFKKAAYFLANDSQRDVLVNIGNEHLIDMNKWNLYQRTQWETSAFNLFEKKFRKYKFKIRRGSCQLAFIEKYQIKMLFIGKNVAIPEWIESKIVKTFADPISGEKCLILKNYSK